MKTKPKIDIELSKVTRFASQGMSQAQMAESLGISEATFQNRVKESAEFRAAIAKGRASSVEIATNKLFAAVKKGSPWAVKFFLERRGGFNQESSLRVSGDPNNPPVRVQIYLPNNGRDNGSKPG